MNILLKALPAALLLSALFSLPTDAATMTNLNSWFVISNRLEAVLTNDIVAAASKGDAEAEYYLGMAYLHGLRGFPTNVLLSREWLLKSARQNCAPAQNTLGWNTAHGIGMATNYPEAVVWYRKAAELGFPQSEMNLARLYRNGTGVAKDLPQAIEWYRKAAEHGFRFAKSELGFVLSDEPELGAEEKTEGLRWLIEAAKEGDANAQNRMGWNYWKGLGVEEDNDQARRWFIASSKQGLAIAMENLYWLACRTEDRETLTNLFAIAMEHAEHGYAPAESLVARMYSGGLGVTQDRGKEIVWYEKAAAQEYGPALQAAGDWYHNSGPNEDRKKAFQYYQRAAAIGFQDAKGRVAELLLSGEGGVTNVTAGIEALHTAAEAGSIDAQRQLAKRYMEGNGVATNMIEAIRWYSAVMTNTSWIGPQGGAGVILGIIYATGDRVPRDDREAFRWFRAAAAYMQHDAMDSLGYCYAMGRGVRSDDEKAVEWFKEGACVDDPDDNRIFYPAVANLGVMYALGRGGLKQNMEKAVALFESAAAHARFQYSCNVPQAQTALAICLYDGNGTKRDVARAFKLFREAADNGNSQAQLHAGILYWLGQGTEKNAADAFTYLEAAAGNKEPGAAAWRDRVAKELTDEQRRTLTTKARSITTSIPICDGMYGHRTWNTGLRIENLTIVEMPIDK